MAVDIDEFRERVAEWPAFEPAEHQRRVETAHAELEALGVDAAIFFDPASICYFTGYSSVNLWDVSAVVLAPGAAPRVVLWEFEVPRFEASATTGELFTFGSQEDPLGAVTNALDGLRLRRYGFDGWTRALPSALADRLRAALPGEATDVRRVLWASRLVKSPDEIERLRSSAAITDRGVAAAVEAIDAGALDCDIASAAAAAMLKEGSGHFAIQPIVAIGPRAGVPHSEVSGRSVRPGEGVFLELGAAVDRYTAPVMRTVAVGEPSAELRGLAEVASEAIASAVDRLRPGASCRDVARAVVDVVTRGRPEILYHGYVGYPVGITFPPSWIEELDFHLHPSNDAELREGMVFHLPISLRHRGERGVGLSCTVAVGPERAEVLTGTEAVLVQR